MKQSEIALIILVAGVSLLASYFLANTFVSNGSNRSEEVEVVKVLSSEFPKPDSTIFNAEALNPTKLIDIGDSGNTNPFQ